MPPDGTYVFTRERREGISLDAQITMLCALQYAIGRGSYVADCVINHIRANRRWLSRKTVVDIIDEITQYSKENRDYPCKRYWLELAKELES